ARNHLSRLFFVWRGAKAHWLLNPTHLARSLLYAARTAGFRAPELRHKKLPTFRPANMRLLRTARTGNCATVLRSSAARLRENHGRARRRNSAREWTRVGSNAPGDRGSKTRRCDLRATAGRLQAGFGQWQR